MANRKLFLLRHAKSDWNDPGLPDDQRPLAPRGHRAAALMRQHLSDVGLTVDLVLCSPAVRTRMTWAEVSGGVAGDPVVEYVPEVYAASAGTLLDVLRGIDPARNSVLLIGHNPGMEQLAARLAGNDPRLDEGMPTCAFAALSFDGAWSELGSGGGRLEAHVRPRDL